MRTLKNILYASLLASTLGFKAECPPPNQPPIINPIPDQEVLEDGSILVDLTAEGYVIDPEGEALTFELISGPPTMAPDGDYVFHDTEDPDITNDSYTVVFRATDPHGASSVGSFQLTQIDTNPIVIPNDTLSLSSGLEALVLGEKGGYIGSERRTRVPIAVDSSNKATIIYRGNGDVSFTKEFDGVWAADVIDHSGIGSYNGIVFEDDLAHVCYTGGGPGTGEDLFYATNPNGIWQHDPIDINPSVGLESDIALHNGNAHISHWSWSTKKVIHTTNESGSFTSEDIADAEWNQTGIAVDSNGHVHMVYTGFESFDDVVKYATNQSGTWTIETISEGSNPVIKLGPHGNPHVASISEDRQSIQYATYNGSWNTELATTYIDPDDVGVKYSVAMALAPDDSAMISYTARIGGTFGVRLPHVASNHTGVWQTRELHDVGEYGNSGIAIDPTGRVHLSLQQEVPGVPLVDTMLQYVSFTPEEIF